MDGASKGSIICGFSMKKIDEIFDKNHEECYKGYKRLKLIESIHGTHRQCIQSTETRKKPYCESGQNPYIDGYYEVDGHKLLHLDNETITSIAVNMQTGTS